MPARKPWTTDDDDALKKLVSDGYSLNRCAKEMRRSKDAVSRHAAKLGIGWDRTRTAQATASRAEDTRARRTKLAVDLLDDIEKIRQKFWQPTVVVSAGQTVFVNEPPASELRNFVTSAGVLIDKHLALVKADTDNGVTEATSMLDKLAGQLGAAHE